MDRLIRKVNGDNQIQGNFGIQVLMDKIYVHVDDIVFITKDCNESIKNKSKTYHKFSKISGIEACYVGRASQHKCL